MPPEHARTDEGFEGQIDNDALARFIRLRSAAIRVCYEAELKRNPAAHGKIVVQFTITTSGTISEASASQDTMGSEEVTACILRQIKVWRTPFRPTADTTVSFPFTFSAAN